jgi:hypothetical protein
VVQRNIYIIKLESLNVQYAIRRDLMNSPSIVSEINDLTPEKFLRMCEELLPGEELAVRKDLENRLNFTFKEAPGDHRNKIFLHNRLEARLRSVPASPGWMGGSYLGEPTPNDKKRRSEHKTAVTKKAHVNSSRKDVMRGNLETLLLFLDASDATRVTGGRDPFLMFTIGKFTIYTTPGMKPVKYSIDGGELTPV